MPWLTKILRTIILGKILYISHGTHKTGGYRHELYMAQELARETGHELQVLRFDRNFKGPFMWFYLFFKAFFAAKADVIITVNRLAWPVYLRNKWNNTKILLVLHNHDENDGKRRIFYKLINSFLTSQSKKSNGKFKNRYIIVYDDFISCFKDSSKKGKEKFLPHKSTKAEFYDKISD